MYSVQNNIIEIWPTETSTIIPKQGLKKKKKPSNLIRQYNIHIFYNVLFFKLSIG